MTCIGPEPSGQRTANPGPVPDRDWNGAGPGLNQIEHWQDTTPVLDQYCYLGQFLPNPFCLILFAKLFVFLAIFLIGYGADL